MTIACILYISTLPVKHIVNLVLFQTSSKILSRNWKNFQEVTLISITKTDLSTIVFSYINNAGSQSFCCHIFMKTFISIMTNFQLEFFFVSCCYPENTDKKKLPGLENCLGSVEAQLDALERGFENEENKRETDDGLDR